MTQSEKIVNGFRFMPPSLSPWIKQDIESKPFAGDIPWTPLRKPVSELTFSLLTTAGINHRTDPPFDMEREKEEPTWGDPTHREIPKDATEKDIDVNHLHINTRYIKEDMNVMFPLARFRELEEEGIIGKLSPTCYSYYGFQFDTTVLFELTMPKIVARMHEEGVDAVLLTPA